MTSLILFLPAFIACGGDDETEKNETTDTTDTTTTDNQTATETETETETEQAVSILTLTMDDERKFDSYRVSYDGSIEVIADGITGTVEYTETINDEASCSANLLASGILDEEACDEFFAQNEVCYTYTYTIDTEEGECAFDNSAALNLSEQNCVGFLAYASSYVDEDFPDETQENVVMYGRYCDNGSLSSTTESDTDLTQSFDIQSSMTDYFDRLFLECDDSTVYSETTDNYIGASAITGNLGCSVENEVADIYTFEATAGQTLTSTALTTEKDIDLYLVDSNDCLVQRADWSVDGCDADSDSCKSINQTIAADGTYKLLVASSGCWDGLGFDYQIDAQLQ